MTDLNCCRIAIAVQSLFQLREPDQEVIQVTTISVVEGDIPNLTGGHHERFS